MEQVQMNLKVIGKKKISSPRRKVQMEKSRVASYICLSEQQNPGKVQLK